MEELVLLLRGLCCTHSACHGILFPFPFRTALCCVSPNCVHRAVQARLCHKRCRHIIGLGPLSLIYDVIPFALAAVRDCPYHDTLPFCHSLPITLDPAPHLPLVATCSIAWSVGTSVLYTYKPQYITQGTPVEFTWVLPQFTRRTTGDTDTPSRQLH